MGLKPHWFLLPQNALCRYNGQGKTTCKMISTVLVHPFAIGPVLKTAICWHGTRLPSGLTAAITTTPILPERCKTFEPKVRVWLRTYLWATGVLRAIMYSALPPKVSWTKFVT